MTVKNQALNLDEVINNQQEEEDSDLVKEYKVLGEKTAGINRKIKARKNKKIQIL